MEFLSEHGGDDRAGNDPCSSYSHNHLGIVAARNLERERARELAEKRPLHMQNSL